MQCPRVDEWTVLIKVVDLMRWYDVTDSLACTFAKQLLDNVGTRHAVFSVLGLTKSHETQPISKLEIKCEFKNQTLKHNCYRISKLKEICSRQLIGQIAICVAARSESCLQASESLSQLAF